MAMTKIIRLIMPFDSDDKIKKRAAALKYKVVKQLVEFYFSEADTGVDFN